MAGIFGHLNVSDSERVFNATVGQRVIFEAAQAYINRVNEEINRATAVFIERSTSDYKLRYMLPGGGYLQRRGPDGRYGAVKAYGSWDVAMPLEDFGAMIVGNDVDMAYMMVGELERHINTIVAQNVNTIRYEILHRLLDNVATTFVDPRWGSLTVQPLANTDGTLYPPVMGSVSEAQRERYDESNYADSGVSDTNDPFETIVSALEDDFGQVVGGSNIVTFVNSADRAYYEALTNFIEVIDNFVRAGQQADIPVNLPTVPGRIIGRHKSGTWISEWDFIPDNYLLGVHLEAEAPLLRRIDPADTGLGDGLQLVSQDQDFPFNQAVWRHRFGLGVGNRLNGYVMELGTGGTYTIPTAYD